MKKEFAKLDVQNNYIFFRFQLFHFFVGVVVVPFDSSNFLFQKKNPQMLIAFHLNECALET